MLTLLACAPLFQAHGQTPEAARSTEDGRQERVALSDEATQAMARFRAPEGFRIELFAAEPLMANPVAFCFDALGRAYVAETYRHSKGVTDIRSHMDWLEDDLAIKTVADRVAMFRKHEGDDGLARGYAVETDRVTRVEDTDGDGVADSGTIFADGFTDPAAGIGAGVLARALPGGGTEVWYTCIPDVWRLVDADDDGVAEGRVAQSTGYGLRVALLGHDLHGLTIGPDGRMYFSIGDRGFNVTTAEGERLVRHGTGGVFRCELDGSDLELFCDGLRNPQELVFDELGNLFTLDNNSDGGDKARWTWLLEGSDTGWRQAYQWVRQPTSRGPWNQEKLWEPFHAEQPAYVLPPIANFTAGPSGLTLYPGTGWGEDWRGTFFVCDFRGNPGYSGIYAYENERKGAGFELVRTREFVWDALPTDVDFGPDGDLYWTDWVTGWNQTGKGRMYRVTPLELAGSERVVRSEVAALLAGGVEEFEDTELVARLFDHRDRRVRMEAQLSMARRALEVSEPEARFAAFLPVVECLLDPGASRRARLHATWCLWHVARLSPDLKGGLCTLLNERLTDRDAEIVAQAARVLGDLGWEPAVEALTPLLGHGEPRVRLFATQALGRTAAPGTVTEPLVALLAASVGADPWLRHACIRALELQGSRGAVQALVADHPDDAVRRALAVVLRRWKDPSIARALADSDSLVRGEAARAIHDVPIPGAMGALVRSLATAPEDTDDLTWRRMVHAAREVGTPEAAGRLADFAAGGRGPVAVRAEALGVLAAWGRPRTRDGIVMDHRPLAAGEGAAALRDHAVASVEFARSAVAAKAGRIARALVQLHRSLTSPGAAPPQTSEALGVLALAESLGAGPRRAAFEALLADAPDSEATRRVHASVAADVKSPLAALSFSALDDGDAANRLALLLNDAEARAEAVRILGGLRGERSVAAFVAAGSAFDERTPELVEWLEAAETHPAASVQELLATRRRRWVESEDPLAGWRMCLEGGDARKGKALFATKSETSCIKCHIVDGEGGSEAGPVLDGVGERLTPEARLLSIVDPNADIAEGFQSWLLLLDDGEAMSGRIVEESDDLVVLETNQKEQFELHPEEIERRKRDVSAMPADVASHLSRREMRDLLAYLATL